MPRPWKIMSRLLHLPARERTGPPGRQLSQYRRTYVAGLQMHLRTDDVHRLKTWDNAINCLVLSDPAQTRLPVS
jgi:hypothetical protein